MDNFKKRSNPSPQLGSAAVSLNGEDRDNRESMAVTGPIVDCYDDVSWDQLRVEEDGLLIVDSHGTIVQRGQAHELADTCLLDTFFFIERPAASPSACTSLEETTAMAAAHVAFEC